MPAAPTLPSIRSSGASDAGDVRRRLRSEHGLTVDGATARYLARRLDADDEKVLSFPCTDCASGEWGFRVLPAVELRGH